MPRSKSKSKPPPTMSASPSEFSSPLERTLSACVDAMSDMTRWIDERKFRRDWPVDVEHGVAGRILAQMVEAQAEAERSLAAYGDFVEDLRVQLDELKDAAREHATELEDAEHQGRRLGIEEAAALISRCIDSAEGDDVTNALVYLLNEVEAL